MDTLTRKEEEIMQILWKLKKGFVKEILAELPEPKPSYNTVSTIVRILEKKEFVSYEAFGKTHRYFPLISKLAYKKQLFTGLLKDYFDNSYQSMFSFLVKEKELTESEIEEMKKIINNNK